MVEIGITLAIVATIMVAGFFWIRKIQMDSQILQARNDALAAMSASMTAVASSPNTTAATTQVLSTMGVWPRERISNTGQTSVVVRGVFKNSRETIRGNTINIASGTTVLAPGMGLIYNLSTIPREACTPLATALANHPAVAFVWAVDYNSSAAPAEGSAAGTLVKNGRTAAVNMASLAQVCGGGSQTKRITVAYYKQ